MFKTLEFQILGRHLCLSMKSKHSLVMKFDQFM